MYGSSVPELSRFFGIVIRMFVETGGQHHGPMFTRTGQLTLLLLALALACSPRPGTATLVIRNGTLIDPDGGASRTATIVIQDGKVARVSETGLPTPPGAAVVDASGQYIVPGFWDMHVHAHREDRRAYHYPLYIAHGVTTIRDAGTHLATALSERVRTEADGLGPSVIWGSPPIDGSPAVLSFGLVAEDPDGGRAIVRQMKAAGFDFVKTYDRLSTATYRAILAEASRQRIPVEGHVPLAASPQDAVAGGQRTIDHLTLVLESCVPGALEWTHQGSSADSMALLTDGRLAAALDRYDAAACNRLFAAFVAAGTGHVPTLVQMRGAFLIDDPRVTDHPGIAMVPEAVRSEWRKYRAEAIPKEVAAGSRVYLRQRQLVGDMHRAGVRLLAGTDASNEPFVVPGWSLHDELQELTEAGLSPVAAIQAATTAAARHLRPGLPTGFEVGAEADLVLLRADPRLDIRNTRQIDAVILRGRALTRRDLDALIRSIR
jgi:imidazolonepropionase-like amidohydrolase